MRAPRFVVHESEGYLQPAYYGGKQPGTTITVHDTYYNWRTVALFRTEDDTGGRGPGGHYLTRAAALSRIRAQAEAFCAILNEDA